MPSSYYDLHLLRTKMFMLVMAVQAVFASPPAHFSPGPSQPLQVQWEDPVLSDLLNEAQDNNPSILAQTALAQAAKASANISRAGLLPMVSLYSNWSESPIESLAASGMPISDDAPSTYQVRSSGVSASMPVDIFGAGTFSWRSSHYTALAAEGNAEAVALSISTAVSNGWYQLLTMRAVLAVTEKQVAIERQLLELIDIRHKRGDASMLDLLQQRQSAAAMESTLPSAKLNAARAAQTLAVLVGRNPDTNTFPEGVLPVVPSTPSIGKPSDLQVRRPDLRAALHAQTAAGKAKSSAWLSIAPAIALSGSVGTSGIAMDEWSESDVWSVGVSASMPIFTSGMATAGIQLVNANARAADANTAAMWLTAIQEVEAAIVGDATAAQTLTATSHQLNAATTAWDEAQKQYAEGVASYLTVANTNQAFRRAELSHLSAKLNQIIARITLFDALGASVK